MYDKQKLTEKAENFKRDFEGQFRNFEEESNRHEQMYFNHSPRIEHGLSNVGNAAPATTRILNEITKHHLEIIALTSVDKEERRSEVDKAVTMHWSELESIKMEQLEQEYWDMHNDTYKERLSRLRSQLDDQEIHDIAQSGQIVVIPAMNEFRLHEAVKTLDESLHPTKQQRKQGVKESPVNVIIYFNFKDEEIPQDVIQSLELALKQNRNINVHVIREHVPDDNTVQDSKKVALDLGLALKGSGRDIPILMLDADITELNHGILQKLVKGLNNKPWTPRAISSYYEIPKSMLQQYPAMYYYFKILKESLDSNSKGKFERVDLDSMQKAYGGFLLAHARTFMQAGGFLPYRNTFEDTLFIFQLECLMNGSIDTINFWPVNAAKEFDTTAYIATNYTREMKAVLENKEAMSRWGSIFDTNEQNKEAGSRREDFSQIDHPLLKKYNLNGNKGEMFRTVIQHLASIEFKDDWVTNYAMQSVVFVAYIKIAIEAGITKGKAVEIWTDMFPNFKENMYKGKLQQKRDKGK